MSSILRAIDLDITPLCCGAERRKTFSINVALLPAVYSMCLHVKIKHF